MRKLLATLMLVCGVVLPAVAFGQGLLIIDRDDWRLPRPMPIVRPTPFPRPNVEGTYKIKEIGIDVNLQDQIAKVQMSQTFVNTGSTQMEVQFVFPLPYDGAIDRLTFMVDGKEYEAKLLAAPEARAVYESYVRRYQDPALMEWIGTGMFKTSVFPVPPGAERKVTMRYSQLCRKQNGLTELLFPLSTAKYSSKPVEELNINVSIQSGAKIKNVYSPTHTLDVKRPSNVQATAKVSIKNEVPQSDFRLLYDVGDESVGAKVISYRPDSGDEGYFLMLVSPEIKAATAEQQKKTVILAVDRSGSMAGKKMEQAKNALKFVLNNLREGDLFNIVAYDSTVESYKPELQKFNDENRKVALGWVEGLYAGGSTNIDGALKAALSQLKDDKQPSYVIFLTDGLPTTGETKEPKIVANAKDLNKVRARIFCFGVGYDLNAKLMDKLSRVNFGQSDYVRPSEDIEASVSKLYNRIGTPVMTDIGFKFDVENLPVEKGAAVSRVYPRDAYDLFAGDQLVLVGRYKVPGAAKVTLNGKVGGNEQKLDFPAQLIDKSGDETYAFVEKLWATRRVGEILDDIDLNGKTDETVNELVTLATKHGILTPYTSFLAEDNVMPPAGRPVPLAALRDRANREFDALAKDEGKDGVEQRRLKADFQKAAAAPAPGNARFAGAGGGRGEAGEQQVAQNVLNVGSRTFFRQGNQWVDSRLNEEKQQKAKKIARYSKEYFDLVAKHGKDVAKYLAMEGEVMLELDGEAYSF